MSLETMTKLATYTVDASGIASVTFSNIPQGYTDLVIKASYRSNRSAGDYGNVGVRFNSDTTSPYFSRYLYSYSTGVYSTTDAVGVNTYTRVAGASQATQTANYFTNNEIVISNYSGNTQKTVWSEFVSDSNTTMNYMGLIAGRWDNPSPVTSITVLFDDSPYVFVQYSSFTLYGVKNAQKTAGNSIKATGGNIVFDGTYVYHVFPASGTFTPTQSISADCLVVAGGGGGGWRGARGGGGGGAGGLLAYTSQSLTATGYTITVGGGGAGASVVANPGSQGGNSQFGVLTASVGGGYGAAFDGGTGGSGGGAAGANGQVGGAATSGQGFAGGNALSSPLAGAGGGGAGAVGASSSASTPGAGGIGATSALINSLAAATGTGQNSSGTYYYAGGGGGGIDTTSGAGAVGGTGGGGQGGVSAGTAFTGAGGGGGSSAAAFSGGSGIVIVRYKG
jgi:hypothetical protein